MRRKELTLVEDVESSQKGIVCGRERRTYKGTASENRHAFGERSLCVMAEKQRRGKRFVDLPVFLSNVPTVVLLV